MPRVFVNGVMTDGLARRVAAQVLDQAADPTSALIDPSRGVPAEGTSAIPDERIDDYVGAMVEAAFQLDDAKLSYRAPVLDRVRAKDRVGALRQLGMFIAFAAEKILWMPYWFVAFFRDGFAAALQRLFQGSRGRLEVVAGSGSDDGSGSRSSRVDSRDRMLLSARSTLVAAEVTAQEALHTPAAASALRSTPRLWTGLRELVFGSLDGSADLEDRGFTPIEDKTPVFGRVSDVLPDAHDVWSFPGDVLPVGFPATVGSQNLHEGTNLREKIGSAMRDTRLEVDDVQKAYDAAQSEYVEAAGRFDVLQKYLLAQGGIVLDDEGRPSVLVPALPSGEADPAAAEAVSGSGSADDPFASIRPYLTEYLALPVRLETLERSGTEFGADLDRLAARLETYRTALNSFETWLAERERSFLWKMLARMNRMRDTARSDLAGFERSITATVLPEPGTLVRLRQNFHGRIGLATFVLVLIGIIAVLLPQAVRVVREWPPYPADWKIVVAIVVLIVIFLLGYMIAYYRGWSEFDRTVSETLDELYQLGRATTQVRSELHRLASLHGQSMDWLELLAVSLYKPWAVKPAWLDSGLSPLDTLAMPFAMQVAQAYEGNSSESVRLQHAAARSLVRSGWRARAFEEMLAEIGARLGLSSEQLGLDALDHDLPHASNNSRRIVRDNMTDEALLEAVARIHLGELIQAVQSGALYESKPRVRRLVSDPLASLQSDAGGIETSAEDLEWSSFLTGTLGDESDPITPLSALGIAPFEVQDGHHIEPSTYVLAPARIAAGLASREGRRVHISSYSDAVARPLDIVLRIDLAGPLPLSAVHLWGEGKRRHPQLADALAAVAAARVDAPRCPQCGKTSCPAADPASGAACVNSGI